jgi:hypothetical protein
LEQLTIEIIATFPDSIAYQRSVVVLYSAQGPSWDCDAPSTACRGAQGRSAFEQTHASALFCSAPPHFHRRMRAKIISAGEIHEKRRLSQVVSKANIPF